MAKRHAIIVGIDAYAFRPLASAVNDAVAMRKALTTSTADSAAVFAESEVTLLATPLVTASPVAGSQPATRDGILNQLKAHYDDNDPAAFLLFYFAGHGLVASREGRVRETVILPSDVPAAEEGRNMISVTELLALFAERGPLQQLWIVDACRDMPYKRRPRGYEIDWPEQSPQTLRAQVAIFAVAPGGTALSEAGGQGRFTGFLVDGLDGRGSAVEHLPGRGHGITPQSLHEYARRRVAKALDGFDDWTTAVQMPTLLQSGEPIEPLRLVPAPAPQPFDVTVRPAAARSAIDVALEVQPGIPVPGWPPTAPPRIYELRARLRPGMEALGWDEPKPQFVAVDLREDRSATIDVPRRERVVRSVRHAAVLPTTGDAGVSRAVTVAQRPSAPDGRRPSPTAELTVTSADLSISVRLRQAETPWSERTGNANQPILLPPGAWDVAAVIGGDTISTTRVVLTEGEARTVQTVPQITPATASLLAAELTNAAPGVTTAGVGGRIQGAILPTFLPLLGLKLYDTRRAMAAVMPHLEIPAAPFDPSKALSGSGPFAVAFAREGVGERAVNVTVDGAKRAWTGADRRVVLFTGTERNERQGVTIRVGRRRFNVAAPAMPRGVTVISSVAWPDGRIDWSVAIFALPVGRLWDEGRRPVPPDRIARLLAVAAPLFSAGTPLENIGDEVLTELAYGKWVDPVLGAFAFHAHDAQIAHESSPDNLQNLRYDRAEIQSNMAKHFAALADARIIAALADDPKARRQALNRLLDADDLGQPVLTASLAHLAQAAAAAGRHDHWSVERFDRLVPGQVFNAVDTTEELPHGIAE
jgi:hypothetical protein